MGVSIGELLGKNEDKAGLRQKSEVKKIKRSLMKYACPKCRAVNLLQMEKNGIYSFTDQQRKIYQEFSKRPHLCNE